jgi:exonuclease SbcC
MIKLVHSADFHFSRENQIPALQSLKTFANTGIEQDVDLFVIAGDLFDRAVQNTASSGLPELQRVIQRMMDHAPVVAVTGTPTHDIPGAYEVLTETNAEHKFTLLYPGVIYFLKNKVIHAHDHSDGKPTNAELLIFGCPEPSKEWFLSGRNGLSRDEATQAVIKGMRDIFLGFAATRKEYSDIPCLMVYHGEVSGASMCNGQTLPQGGIAVGRDDLAMVNADYYAFGHIHLAQQIGDLPAYYSGSAFPVDWGETEQKQFNIVELNDLAQRRVEEMAWGQSVVARLTRIDYPHPPRKKIVCEKMDLFADGELDGYQVWAVIRGDKRDLATFDTDRALRDMLNDGALPGSRVTTEIIPTETIRAGEIQEAKSLWDKVTIYAENTGEEIRKIDVTLREKAEALEAEARREGLVSEGAHIRIDSLSLRGAIGIKKGTGNDEIYLDFNSFDSGLIALLGSNGAGKTTLIENLHPYATMLTRGGKLQDHFFLRDSWRDLRFTDCKTDSQYRALIHIDGANASGSCEYHLYRDGQPLVNGRKADYEEKITELFGSLALYVRSAFTAQKASKQAPDLASATQSEKKALFRELAGLEYLQTYSEAAREKAKAIENETERDKGRIEQMKSQVEKMPELDDQHADLVARQKAALLELADVEEKGEKAKQKAAELESVVSENRRIESRTAELKRQGEELVVANVGLVSEREGYEAALEKQAQAEYEQQEYDKLQKRKGEIEREQAEEYKRRDQARTEYDSQRKAVADIEQELRAQCEKIRQEIQEKREEKSQKVGKIDYFDAILQQPIDTTCPTCKQELPPDVATQLKAERAEQQKTLEGLQAEVFDIDQDIAAFEKAEAKLKADIDALEWPAEPHFKDVDDSTLSQINESLTTFPVEEIRITLEKAKVAAAKLETIDVQVKANKDKLKAVRAEVAELESNYNFEADEAYQEVTRELEELRDDYQKAREKKTAVEVELKGVERQIEALTETGKELEALEGQVKQKVEDAQEWRYLETACGPNGIQALELDALAPSIADVANRLLASAYDARFQIEFRTTRIAGEGSKTKQVEDFEIVIHDSKDGSEQPLDTLSGGESVWIKKAIYDAFGIIRAKNTGTQFLTVFLDEADGALDTEAKVNYFRLLEAAHNESGRHHTVVITHSTDIQEMIPQRIVMTELQAKVKEVA